jgi:hypothetical protein
MAATLLPKIGQKAHIVCLGDYGVNTVSSVDIKPYCTNYKKLTNSNFLLDCTAVSGGKTAIGDYQTFSAGAVKSYNPNTGILTVGFPVYHNKDVVDAVTYGNVYLVY